MNNEEIDRLKDAYFAGKSSKEDEKRLKSTVNDPFFKALKEEQDQTMDWSFDDFLAIAEQEEPVKKVGVFSFRKPFYWAAASIAFVVFGTLFLVRNTTIEQPQYAQNKDVPSENINPNPTEEPVVEEEIRLPEKTVVKTVSKQIKRTQIPEEIAYNPEYVIINGKPIYDLEEAKELTMNSLNLLANNVEKSVSEMENVKRLSIKF